MYQKIQVAVRMRPPRGGETYDSAIQIHDHANPDSSASSCVKLTREGRAESTEFKYFVEPQIRACGSNKALLQILPLL
jgi:hypothetical protein